MFWRSLAAAGLAGLLTVSSCKSYEPVAPMAAAWSEFSSISPEKKQKLLEELVEEARAEGEDLPIKGIYYYGGQSQKDFYEALEEKLGLSAEKIEMARKGLALLHGRFYAITIGGPKGSAIAVFDALFEKAKNLDDIRSNAIDHEGQHARDFREIDEFRDPLEKMVYELRGLTWQIFQAYAKKRKLSMEMGRDMLFKFQCCYLQTYLLALKGYEKSREVLSWVNQQMDIYPGTQAAIMGLDKYLETAGKK